jgi:hypothetical protein
VSIDGAAVLAKSTPPSKVLRYLDCRATPHCAATRLPARHLPFRPRTFGAAELSAPPKVVRLRGYGAETPRAHRVQCCPLAHALEQALVRSRTHWSSTDLERKEIAQRQSTHGK